MLFFFDLKLARFVWSLIHLMECILLFVPGTLDKLPLRVP